MTRARSELVSPETTLYYHCVGRCVRRAYLCGEDFASGRSYEHRKRWVTRRLKDLEQVFAISVCAYAVMSNHYHVVLRLNPDEAEAWSDGEVAERWGQLFDIPQTVDIYVREGGLEPQDEAIARERLAAWRVRLSSLSWFMRCLNEHIARKANLEDGCTGRFWEGRFKSQALLGEKALIACMAYVDLNPVRAGIAQTPEASNHTSIQQRIREAHGRPRKTLPRLLAFQTGDDQPADPECLPLPLPAYLELVDATGRAVRLGKRGAIPKELPPILERIGMEPRSWLRFLHGKAEGFHFAIGPVDELRAFAGAIEGRFLKGLSAARALFPS